MMIDFEQQDILYYLSDTVVRVLKAVNPLEKAGFPVPPFFLWKSQDSEVRISIGRGGHPQDKTRNPLRRDPDRCNREGSLGNPGTYRDGSHMSHIVSTVGQNECIEIQKYGAFFLL